MCWSRWRWRIWGKLRRRLGVVGWIKRAFGSGVCVTMHFDGDEMKCEETPVGSGIKTTTNGDESTSNSNRNIASSGSISSNSSKTTRNAYIVVCDLEGEKNTVKILKDLNSLCKRAAFTRRKLLLPRRRTKVPRRTLLRIRPNCQTRARNCNAKLLGRTFSNTNAFDAP